MNHVEETLDLAYTLREYENQARAEFDRRVALESGTFGWETFSLCVLSLGAAVCTVLGALRGLAWLVYPSAATVVLCVTMLLSRWYASRRQESPSGPRS
jgi:Flp pilus assembly protein TadB